MFLADMIVKIDSLTCDLVSTIDLHTKCRDVVSFQQDFLKSTTCTVGSYYERKPGL